MLAVKGLGPLTCAALLVAVGAHPERMRSESAFAHLCGVAPLPASSGKTSRHRLNRGGDRQASVVGAWPGKCVAQSIFCLMNQLALARSQRR